VVVVVLAVQAREEGDLVVLAVEQTVLLETLQITLLMQRQAYLTQVVAVVALGLGLQTLLEVTAVQE
jgi:hypothetical protein